MMGRFACRAVSERVRLGAYRRPRLDAAVGLPRLRAGLMRIRCACTHLQHPVAGSPQASATAAHLRRAKRPRPLYRAATRPGEARQLHEALGSLHHATSRRPACRPSLSCIRGAAASRQTAACRAQEQERRPLNLKTSWVGIFIGAGSIVLGCLDSAAPRAVLASAVYRLRRRFVSEGTPRAGRSRQLQPSPPPVPQRPRRTHRAPHSAAASSRIFPRRLGDEGSDLNSGVGRCAGCAAL